MAEGSSDTQFWLVSLPLEARNRGRDGGEQVLGTLQEKCGDLATTHKVGGPYARVSVSVCRCSGRCLLCLHRARPH
jgi:hypothetical protein